MAKSFAVRLVLVMVLSLMSVVSVSVHASQGKLPPQFSADKDYHAKVAEVEKILLARRGFKVISVKPISVMSKEGNKRYLKVQAYKEGLKYEIELDYLTLKIVKENKIGK